MEIVTIGLSCISIVVAIISFINSSKSQKLQNRINEIELKLKSYELAEKEQKKSSCVEARIIHVVNNKYKIKIWNSGNSTAKNIKVSYENHDLFCLDSDKLPFEFLEPSKSFELSLIIYTNSPRKVLVTTEWENEFNEKNTKTQLCDF